MKSFRQLPRLRTVSQTVHRTAFILCILASLVIPARSAQSQEIDMDAVRAREEFRWGVAAYQSGLFSEALLAFERGLSFDPNDLEATEWLGHTYYRLGFNETALSLWERVVDAGEADATLLYLIETLTFRRGVGRELGTPDRYINTFDLDGTQPDFRLFSRPSSIFPRSDGGFYIASLAGHQVLRFNANSALVDRFLGGVSGLDKPFDVVEVNDEYLFISESGRNTIYRSDLKGQNVLRFGELGVGDGQLIMPQYLAVDTKGYLYVSEAGNSRVSKFDFDGNFILSFGEKTDDFGGFLAPTGVVVHNDQVFVCDQRRRGVYVFDSSGNYLGSIAEGELEAPEGLSIYQEDVLLLADTTSLKIVDIENEAVERLIDESISFTRLTKAAVDANGHVLATDFNENRITVLSRISSLYTGLLVEVTRIDATRFPKIITEIRVETREGEPVIGLDESNFLLSERSGSVSEPLMIDPEPSLQARVALVVENSDRLDKKLDIVSSSFDSMYDSLKGVGGLSVYLAGEMPLLVGDSQESRTDLLRRMTSPTPDGSDWRVDAALRLGASELTGFPGSRSVVLFTSGVYGDSAFTEYAPDILAAFFRNNGITFHCVYFSPLPADREIFDYLCSETGGESFYAYRATGIGELADRIRDAPTGRYFFEYQSNSPTNFGDAYIPVQAEVLFYKRTGRGASAYFPPREF